MSMHNGLSDVRCESYTSSALLDQFETCRHDLSNSGCGSYTSIPLLDHCDTSISDISDTRLGHLQVAMYYRSSKLLNSKLSTNPSI